MCYDKNLLSLFSDLRSAKHSFSGHLIMNICIALIGFYLMFLIAGHVTTIQPLCGVVAALIQYFLLAYFVWTAVAAVVLYLSIVYWFKKQGPTFVLKAAIIAWRKYACMHLLLIVHTCVYTYVMHVTNIESISL